jgi:hypothetical protein
MYFSFKTTILVVQVHQIIHHWTSSLLYKIYNSYFSSSYMFFFPILWCYSSGNQCFLFGVKFHQNAKIILRSSTFTKSFFFLSTKMPFFGIGYGRFRMNASTSHQIITSLPKKNICLVLSYWCLHLSLSAHHTK